MSNKYVLHGKLSATEGKGEELASILLEASTLVSTAKGCHLYIVSKEESLPDSIFITEVWDSKEDHAASLKVDGVMDLIGKAMPILDGNPSKGQELSLLGGYGLKK